MNDNHGKTKLQQEIYKIVNPLRVKFYPRDVVQVMVGASILAIPVGFTEETWRLGEVLPLKNIFALMLLSLLFISAFVYYNYYRNHMEKHYDEFFKRVFTTYALSFIVVAVLLSIIQRAPWTTDALLAFKRIVLVSFPASMSAAVADMIK